MKKKIKTASLLGGGDLPSEKQTFKNINTEMEIVVEMSFKIAREITVDGKCFTEGSFLKQCTVYRLLCTEGNFLPRKESNICVQHFVNIKGEVS